MCAQLDSLPMSHGPTSFSSQKKILHTEILHILHTTDFLPLIFTGFSLCDQEVKCVLSDLSVRAVDPKHKIPINKNTTLSQEGMKSASQRVYFPVIFLVLSFISVKLKQTNYFSL